MRLMRNIFIATIVSVPFVFSSCVSKKKYLEMESNRNKAENRIEILSQEIDSVNSVNLELKNEFGMMKNELHLSNAIKDSYIDSLNVRMVENDLNKRKKDADMADQVYSFQTEKRQLRQSIMKSEERIAEMSEMMESQSAQISQMKTEAIELKFQLNNQKDETNAVENKLKLKEKQIANRAEELNKIKSEIGLLKKDIFKKDEEIEKLSNQVKLLKKELGL